MTEFMPWNWKWQSSAHKSIRVTDQTRNAVIALRAETDMLTHHVIEVTSKGIMGPTAVIAPHLQTVEDMRIETLDATITTQTDAAQDTTAVVSHNRHIAPDTEAQAHATHTGLTRAAGTTGMIPCIVPATAVHFSVEDPHPRKIRMTATEPASGAHPRDESNSEPFKLQTKTAIMATWTMPH